MKKLQYKDSEGNYQDLYKVYEEDSNVNEPNQVDMGDAGIWCTHNIGASKPEETGLYFAWGETEGYPDASSGKSFSWSDYKFGTSSNLTKYNSTDGLMTLEPEDDAAHVMMGDDWKIPTQSDYVKLHNLCNTEWTNDYQSTGIQGQIYKLKTDESKQLFFPVTGYCKDGVIGSSTTGYYWCCKRDEASDNSGTCVDFEQRQLSEWDFQYRNCGQCIRAFIPKS